MKSVFSFLICFLCLFSAAYARIDNKTYNHVVDVQAVWINPKNIKVYVEPSNKSHILKNAINIWDSALRSNMNFKFIENKNEADITMDFIEHLEDNQVGVAKSGYINIQGKIYLHKVNVLISKTDPIGFIQNDAELLKVTLHEIGHAIGLLGHSNSINDIMYYSTAGTKNTSPSLRDIETVNKLYGF